MFEKLFQIECLLYSCSPSSDVGPYIVRKLSDRSSSLEGKGRILGDHIVFRGKGGMIGLRRQRIKGGTSDN